MKLLIASIAIVANLTTISVAGELEDDYVKAPELVADQMQESIGYTVENSIVSQFGKTSPCYVWQTFCCHETAFCYTLVKPIQIVPVPWIFTY